MEKLYRINGIASSCVAVCAKPRLFKGNTLGTRRAHGGDCQCVRCVSISGCAAVWGPHSDQSQRDCDLQPKVARSYLGSQFGNKFNRNAVVAKCRDAERKRNCRNRVAVGNVCWTMTQGSAQTRNPGLCDSIPLGLST